MIHSLSLSRILYKHGFDTWPLFEQVVNTLPITELREAYYSDLRKVSKTFLAGDGLVSNFASKQYLTLRIVWVISWKIISARYMTLLALITKFE